MSNILYWGDSPLVGTGYGRLARGILPALVEDGHNVRAIGMSSGPEDRDEMFRGVKVMPASLMTDDPMGMRALLRELPQADALFIIGDPLLIPPRRIVGSHAKMVWYTGIDMAAKPNLTPFLDDVDVHVAANRYGVNCIRAASRSPNMYLIPHGHDLETFKPGPSDFRARLGIDDDAVVLTNIAQNTPKKNLSSLIEAFALFRRKLRREGKVAHLFLQSAAIDRVMPFNVVIDLTLVCRTQKLTVGQDVIFGHYVAGKPTRGTGHEAADMANILRGSDAFVSSSMSEGWCLPMTEAMACKVPVIVPQNTVFPELASERGWIYPIETQTPDAHGWPWSVIAHNILAGMDAWWAARKKGHDSAIIDRAHAWVQTLSWDNVVEDWKELFRRLHRS